MRDIHQYKSDYELTKDTPWLAREGEGVWGACNDYFGEKLPCFTDVLVDFWMIFLCHRFFRLFCCELLHSPLGITVRWRLTSFIRWSAYENGGQRHLWYDGSHGSTLGQVGMDVNRPMTFGCHWLAGDGLHRSTRAPGSCVSRLRAGDGPCVYLGPQALVTNHGGDPGPEALMTLYIGVLRARCPGN